jgi:hypothetical protein
MSCSANPPIKPKGRASRYILPAPAEKLPQQASSAVIQGDYAYIAAAEVFRRLSRNESPWRAEAEPAVVWLINRPGWSKTKDEVWDFFSGCICWFHDKRETFAAVDDKEVCRQVGNRFRAWLEQEDERITIPKLTRDKPPAKDGGDSIAITRPDQMPVNEDGDEIDCGGDHWKDLIPMSQEDAARDQREIKKDQRVFKRLEKLGDPVSLGMRDILIKKLQRKVEGEKDKDQRLLQEDNWKAAEAVNAAIKKGSSKK